MRGVRLIVAFAFVCLLSISFARPAAAVATCFINSTLYPADIVIAAPGITTNGTAGNDVIYGTNGADIINGLGGDDVICGRGGADIIDGGDQQ